jgi:hypothetical protein
MKVNAASQLRRTFGLLNASEAHEKVKQNELYAGEVQKLTQLHLKYVMFTMARQRVTEHKFTDPTIPAILLLLIRIYALKELIKDNQCLYEEGFFRAGSISLLTEAYNGCLQ